MGLGAFIVRYVGYVNNFSYLCRSKRLCRKVNGVQFSASLGKWFLRRGACTGFSLHGVVGLTGYLKLLLIASFR